jgi:hypothetical protein
MGHRMASSGRVDDAQRLVQVKPDTWYKTSTIASIVSDSYSATDYKFAGIDVAAQRLVIGQLDRRATPSSMQACRLCSPVAPTTRSA